MQASLNLSSIYALQSGLKYTGHLRFHHSQRHSKQIESTTLELWFAATHRMCLAVC